MYSSGCAPFFFLFMKGPSKWTPRTSAPSLLPFCFKILGTIVWYISIGEVTIVGQNEVTPCDNNPLATFWIPSSTDAVLCEKSIPYPPDKYS